MNIGKKNHLYPVIFAYLVAMFFVFAMSFNIASAYTSPRAPSVITMIPIGVTTNQATIRGILTTYSTTASYWFEYGKTSSLGKKTLSSLFGTNDIGISVSRTLYNLSKGTTYYYRLVSNNRYGTSYGNLLSFSTNGEPSANSILYVNSSNTDNAKFIITKNASYISKSSALLNGEINPNNSLTTAWFEYGKTLPFQHKTNIQPMGSDNVFHPFSISVAGLSPNTVYYFRAVLKNSHGILYGRTLSFKTKRAYFVNKNYNSTYHKTYNAHNKNVAPKSGIAGNVGVSQCVVLAQSISTEKIIPGKDFIYTIIYKNGCDYSLSNAFLKIIFPSGVYFKKTSVPFFNKDINGISYNLGNVVSGKQLSINILMTAKSNINVGDSLMFNSVLNFTNNRNKLESANSSISAIVGNVNAHKASLGASIASSVDNLFSNWIFVLLLMSYLGFLTYRAFFKKENIEKVDILKDDDDNKNS